MSEWIVMCEDGMQRHDGVFASRDEARHWAEWGHACTNDHRIIDPTMTESGLVAAWTPRRRRGTP